MLRALRIEARLAREWLVAIHLFGLLACCLIPLLPKGGASAPSLAVLLTVTLALVTGEPEMVGEAWNARRVSMPVSRGGFVRGRFVLWGLVMPLASALGTFLMCVADLLWRGGALLPTHALLGIFASNAMYGWVFLGIVLALQLRGARRVVRCAPFFVGIGIFVAMNWTDGAVAALVAADGLAVLGLVVIELLIGIGTLAVCAIVAEQGFGRRDL